jgi:hypothetical protein
MFPNPHNTPPGLSQSEIHAPIPRFVCGEFFYPKCTIAGRHIRMSWAAMPETAVNKHGELLFRKGKVWLAKNRKVSSPACNFILSKQANQRDFCVLVPATANPRHHCRSFCFGENVSHWS